VEREQVRADRLARGVGDAHARETEHVLERPIHDELAERIEQTARERYTFAVEYFLPVTPGDAEEGMECAPLERARVLHTDHDAGEHLLEHTRRREVEGRTDLLHVVHRGIGALRTGHAEGGDQTLRIVE